MRGLDYYTRTTFEFAGGALESAQNALGGGGRYDGLVEEMGGPPTPGIGFGIGLDRTLLACDAEGVLAAAEVAPRLDVFVVDFAGGEAARDITAVAAARRLAGRPGLRRPIGQVAAQVGRPLRRPAGLIIGPDEAAGRRVAVKDLRSGPGTAQELVERAALVEEVRRRLLVKGPAAAASGV